jgi:hypothetical protein
MNRPATSTDLPASTDDVVDQATVYLGYELLNSHATDVATVILRADNSSGALIGVVRLAAGESVGIDRPHGRACLGGIHATITGGTVTGAIFHT